VVLALNLLVTIIKLVVGVASGALAVVADAFHSIVDSSSNIIGLIGVWVSARPADSNHPYGHHKYETIAALGIGGLLLVAGFEIAKSVVERLFGASPPPEITPVTVGLMALTFLVNLAVVAYETRAGKHLQSQLLLADAAHTRTDLFVTLSVIAALIGARLGVAWLDSIVAGAVVVLLVRAAFGILRSTSDVLADAAVANPKAIERIALGVPGVRAASGVRSRGPADATYVDLHVTVHPAMDADQAHGVATEVERRITEGLPGVVDTVVHIEPGRPPGSASPWEDITVHLRGIGDGLGIGWHDLHVHTEQDGGFSIEMHLEVDANLTLGAAHALADQFERRAREALPGVRSIVTHIEPLPVGLPVEHDTGQIARTREAALRQRVIALVDSLAGKGTCHSVELHHVDSHLTLTLHVTQPTDKPLVEMHALAEEIERRLHAHEHSLHRVVVHVEPPE
jgi:cation diffusion facilitator family transporter